MDTRIYNIANIVKESLINEPIKGVNQFVNFSKSFAINQKLKHLAIILNLDFEESKNEDEIKSIVNRMLALIDDIIKDYQENINSVQYTLSVERRNRNIEYFKNIIPQKDTVFLATNLSKQYKKSNFTLSNINIELKLGEITGLVGENGNGKTTLLRLITGDIAQDSGEISYPYLQNTEKIDWFSIKNEIAYVPQDLEEWYGSLKDNLHYECVLHDIKGQKNDEEVDYIIYRLGLSEHINKSWRELSGGFKIRFVLAKALVWKPKLLLIDEPLANLDVNAQLIILNDIRDMANSLKYPVSIMISSQHLFEIECIADKLMFLKDGIPTFYGPKSELGNNRTVNTFELICPIQLKELEEALQKIDIHKIDHTGKEFIIRTGLLVTYHELLETLLQSDIEIVYFRNISSSIKELFL